VKYGDLLCSIDDKNGVDEFRQFLAEGGDIHRSHPNSGLSLMHYACEHQNESLIRALFMADKDLLNTRTACDYPPIFQALDIDIDGAIQTGHPISFETTRLMLELGADPNLKDQKARTLKEFVQIYGDSVVREFDKLVTPLLKE
tara:strand:- start:40697 stop:41128 length:432 start_codon:yes stop_codon:yes gene_type:complete